MSMDTTHRTSAASVILTVHGARRARKRLGLPRRAVQWAVDTAWRDGLPDNGLVRREADPDVVAKIWRGALFYFGITGLAPTLVTVVGAKLVEEKRIGVKSELEFRHWKRQRRQIKSRKRGLA